MTLSQNHHEAYKRSLVLFQDANVLSHSIGAFLQHFYEKNNRGITGAIIIEGDPSESIILNEAFPVLPYLTRVHVISPKDVTPILGQTLDFLVLDLRWTFHPNKVSLLIETVCGGGLVIICGLPTEEWILRVNRSQIPSTKEFRPKSYLLRWFLENIEQNPHCIVENLPSQEILRRFNPMHHKVNLTARIDGFDVTPDQKEVITALTGILLDTSDPNSCSVVVANRGRGKSATIGITLSHLIGNDHQRNQRFGHLIVTAPDLSNVQVLFEFLGKGLREKQVNFQTIKERNLITDVRISDKLRIAYISPSEISNQTKASLIIVDEAAALPIEKLRSIIQIQAQKVLISTIHGYEGSGRGFQHKIVQYLDRQKRIPHRIFNLFTPIRYLEGDLIEKLLNDTFLLDVELSKNDIKEQDINRTLLTLQEYSDPRFLFSNQGIHHLRNLFALLVYAHYRNQPNDLLLLADSAQHFLLGLLEDKDPKGTNFIAASHLAKEGGLSEQKISRIAMGEFIPGNLIPSTAVRHFSSSFAKLRGLRIVRIATHPKLLGKGFGRLTVEAHITKFKGNYDWIGVSYGATTKLVKFWRKFGFLSVHIRPIRTSVSGEWNIVFVLPLSSSAKGIIEQASADFTLQFIALLKQSLFEMRPELVIQILKGCYPIENYTPKLTASARLRLTNYLNGHLNFLLAVDAMYELAVMHFVIANSVKLSSAQEMLLVSRILQGRTWGQTLGKTGLTWKSAQSLIKKTVKKIADSYL
ncbi:MAG: GNAT family N-acetyltransferase [Candidatus Heimdallarchaeota archaeon]